MVPLLLLVARSKLVLDFALTIHFLHLLATSLYTHGLPTHWFWWVLQAASVSLLSSVGIWACQWRELKPINFGGRPTVAVATPEPNSQDSNDEGEGFSRGRGRGRGRDGSGAYEMVEMLGQEDGNV